ncbi:MAG: DUF2889 domain-containing protein [Pontibacterium sp.]
MVKRASDIQRTPLHKRRIEVQGFLREDKLWDIEALLFDTKAYPLDLPDPGVNCVEVGKPLHDMTLTITVDDDLLIVDAYAKMMATPYLDCPNAANIYENLIGIRIGKGWINEVRQALQRNHACTHLTEMLPVLATAAFQTIRGYHLNFTEGFAASASEKRTHLDTCYGFRTGGRADTIVWKNVD